MVTIQIRLARHRYEKLRRTAVEQGRSMADCIREGIDLFLRKSELQAIDLDAIAGKYTPKPMSGLKRHDRWLAEAILDGRRDDTE